MAVRSTITPARLNPSWTPATQPLGMLAKFFKGGEAAPVLAQPAPRRPVPAMEMA